MRLRYYQQKLVDAIRHREYASLNINPRQLKEEPTMTREVYKSSTHGEIPLSFTGRHLLQTLRSAATAAIANGNWHHDCNALSKARGELALYMSRLEAREKPEAERTLVDVQIYPDAYAESNFRLWVKRVFSDGHVTKVLEDAAFATQLKYTFEAGRKLGQHEDWCKKDFS